MLHSDGVIIMKFLLDITHSEQKNRFTEREKDPFKYWKLTEEDWRNRKHWPLYYLAFCDMVKKTNTKHSPWEIIPANSKWFARVKILKLINKKLSQLC